jgi:hypothetical protein
MKAMAAPTTAQSLEALLETARNIMRKDKGLNGNLDRLPDVLKVPSIPITVTSMKSSAHSAAQTSSAMPSTYSNRCCIRIK